jgi:hypothetical protein
VTGDEGTDGNGVAARRRGRATQGTAKGVTGNRGKLLPFTLRYPGVMVAMPQPIRFIVCHLEVCMAALPGCQTRSGDGESRAACARVGSRMIGKSVRGKPICRSHGEPEGGRRRVQPLRSPEEVIPSPSWSSAHHTMTGTTHTSSVPRLRTPDHLHN